MPTAARGWLVYEITGSKALLGAVAEAASARYFLFHLGRLGSGSLSETLDHGWNPEALDGCAFRTGSKADGRWMCQSVLCS